MSREELCVFGAALIPQAFAAFLLPIGFVLTANTSIDHDEFIDIDVHAMRCTQWLMRDSCMSPSPFLVFVVTLLGCAKTWAYPKRSHSTTLLGSLAARLGVG